MRLASFNCENMFVRPAIMNLDSWAAGRKVLDDFARLNDLISETQYSDATKKSLLKTMAKYPGLIKSGKSQYIRLQEVREKLVTRPVGKKPYIKVAGRDGWSGWFELVTDAIKGEATTNTARVIKDLRADVCAVIEIESRPTLIRFNDQFLGGAGAWQARQIMLIDGNDERGIDVGVMCRPQFAITGMTSHVDDTDASGLIFSRDCPEYVIKTPQGNTITVLINHFKSKGFGTQEESDAKRLRQAKRVRELVNAHLLSKPGAYLAVVGDFNDTPDSAPLAPLLKDSSPLVDIMTLASFSNPEGRPGTHGNCTEDQKLDYILLSPALVPKVTACSINRRGIWAGKHGDLFGAGVLYDTIKVAKDAASDHAALWVDLNV